MAECNKWWGIPHSPSQPHHPRHTTPQGGGGGDTTRPHHPHHITTTGRAGGYRTPPGGEADWLTNHTIHPWGRGGRPGSLQSYMCRAPGPDGPPPPMVSFPRATTVSDEIWSFPSMAWPNVSVSQCGDFMMFRAHRPNLFYHKIGIVGVFRLACFSLLFCSFFLKGPAFDPLASVERVVHF